MLRRETAAQPGCNRGRVPSSAMATRGERVSRDRPSRVPDESRRALAAPILGQFQRLLGNQAVRRLLSAGDPAAVRRQGAVLQRKVQKGDNWVAGYGLTGYWSKEQVDAEFVKLSNAHAQLNFKLGKAREDLPDGASAEVAAFEAVEAVWNTWDRQVDWSERETCLSALTAALEKLEKLQPILQQQKQAEEEAERERLEAERLEAERLEAEKRKKQQLIVKQDQPKVGKKASSPPSGKSKKQTSGAVDKAPSGKTPSDETTDVQIVQDNEPKTPQPIPQKKVTTSEKRQRKKEREREEREQAEFNKRKADRAAEEEVTTIRKDNDARIQQVLGEGQSRALNLALQGLLKKLDDMQQARKPNWQSIVVEARTLPAAIATAEEKIKKFDEQQQKAFEKGVQNFEVKRDRARKDAPARIIPLTKLEASIKGLTDRQVATPSDWIALNKLLGEAKAEADAVLELLDAADQYDQDKAQVLERLEQARQLEHSEVDEKTLTAAKKRMEDREKRHQELLLADAPDWAALRSELLYLNAAITQAFRSVIETQSLGAVSGDNAANENEAVTQAVDDLDGGGDWEETVLERGGKWGAYYGNANGYLPVGAYTEYYVAPPNGQKFPAARRLVVDAKGRMFYTWNHYGEQAAPGEPAYVHLT